ncbi:MAG: hypothetical protein SF028_10390 [Candidatus Sumerlaeia bacterium]|nr:hypothetical protein [Candidatus Sumerlaeia bacterium]
MSLLLDIGFMWKALIALAVLLPLAGFALYFSGALRHQRAAFCVGALGPWLLALWTLHEVLIRTIGFDSIATAGILAAVAMASGWLAGVWARHSERVLAYPLADDEPPTG